MGDRSQNDLHLQAHLIDAAPEGVDKGRGGKSRLPHGFEQGIVRVRRADIKRDGNRFEAGVSFGLADDAQRNQGVVQSAGDSGLKPIKDDAAARGGAGEAGDEVAAERAEQVLDGADIGVFGVEGGGAAYGEGVTAGRGARPGLTGPADAGCPLVMLRWRAGPARIRNTAQ